MSSAIPEGATGPGPEDHSEYNPSPVGVSSEPTNIPSEPSSVVPVVQQEQADNPAWNPFRERLPESLFKEVRPELEKWDKNYQQVQQQFAPYKSFAEQGVPPETIQKAMQLAQVLNANPRAVWEQLNSRYNFGAELSGQGQQELQDTEEEDTDEYDPDDPYNPANIDLNQNPQFVQWQEQVAAQAQWQQNVENERIEREVNAELDSQWAEVRRLNNGDLSQQEQLEVIRRAQWIADMKDQQTGKHGFHEADLREGFRDYQQFVQRARGTRANESAPSVLGGTGGIPAQRTGITADMSEDERIAYIAARAEQLSKANQ